MVELQATPAGLLLPVQAQPGARRNGITGIHQGRLKVAVTQAPEKGKANKALIEVLAEALQLKRSQITLVSGQSSPKKTFLVTDCDAAALRERLRTIELD